MSRTGHIAVDLGAETGRVVLGEVRAGKLWMNEVHRFAHRPLQMPEGLCWDVAGLWREILKGLRLAASLAATEKIVSLTVGVDSWGVDWGLIGDEGAILRAPRCYRDPAFARTEAKVRAAWGDAGDAALYAATGNQIMPLNTLFQVLEAQGRDPRTLERGRLLLMPDLFHWKLTGKRTNERTIASTSQMLDCRRGTWARELLTRLGIPQGMLADELTNPGTVIGPLMPEILAETGLPGETMVVTPPTHDTASAVAAVPAVAGSKWAYLSSGTWSLLGAELTAPCVDEASFRANFTNERGIGGEGGSVRFLKNVFGLWLVQECRRCLARAGTTLDYGELTRLARAAAPLRTLVDVSDPRFLAPADMVGEIEAFARETAQPVPASAGELVRCCLESLALEYQRTLGTLSRLVGRDFDVVHLVGGGSKNQLLNQFAADSMGVRVLVGPVEATATGNLLTQAMGAGLVRDVAEMRAIVRETCVPEVYEPQAPETWRAAFARYESLKGSAPAR